MSCSELREQRGAEPRWDRRAQGKLSGRGGTELSFEGYVGNRQVKGSKGQWVQKALGQEREIQRQDRDRRDRETPRIREAEKKAQRKRQRTADCVVTGCSQPSLPPVLGQKIAQLTRGVQSISCAALGTPELYFLRGGAGCEEGSEGRGGGDKKSWACINCPGQEWLKMGRSGMHTSGSACVHEHEGAQGVGEAFPCVHVANPGVLGLFVESEGWMNRQQVLVDTSLSYVPG